MVDAEDTAQPDVPAVSGAEKELPLHPGPTDSKGWDGKLRLEKKPVLANPEAISDAEYSDEENVLPGEQIDADEDLLDDYPSDTDSIDCVHSRVSSIPSLNLDRFKKVARLCLRQNAITSLDGLASLAATLTDLDLYDNLISHTTGVDALKNLTVLDVSFNKLKHIKHIHELKDLKELYLLQNKISAIEGVSGLNKLLTLELGGNRIRKIEGLDGLNIESLWLGKNKITTISGLEHLSALKVLDLKSNRIRQLEGLESLHNLEELHISHNALTSLAGGLAANTKLRVLDISNNAVKSLEGVGHLTDLEELWASYNQLSDFAEVERELADKEQLETVYFEGNMLQLRQPALYRNKVRLALPKIKQIDATFVRVS